MSWTKRQFVVEAFSELGYASYDFDLEPGQLQTALRRLDAMMASWYAQGIRIGYPQPTTPEASDLDTETGVPDIAAQAIYANLAIRLAPTIGKTVGIETARAAREGYRALTTRTAFPPEIQMPGTMPKGAGQKPWRQDGSPFVAEPNSDPLRLAEGGELEFEFGD